MSLKFAAVGSLTVLSPFGLPARASDRAQKFGAAAILSSPRSALQSKRSSGREPPNAIAHRVHIGFRADAVIALVTGSERSPAVTGLTNMLVIVRQKAIGASMSVSMPPLDCGLQRSTGKRMICALQSGLLFAPDKRTGLDRFEATQLLV
jgi:hypothetical protein